MDPATDPIAPAAPRPRHFTGLQARIGLALGVVIILVALGLASALAASARGSFVGLASENIEGLAQQMARELSSGMARFTREIQLQALNPGLSDPAAPTAQLRRQLEGIQSVFPEFAYISVVDARSGLVVAATGGIFEGGNGTGRPVFEEGKKGLFVGDVHDAVRLATLLPRPSSGEPLRFLDVAAPIKDADGRPVRVLASHLSWEWTRQIKERVLEPVQASRQVQVLLVDTSGAVVLSPDASLPVGTKVPATPAAAGQGAPMRWGDGVDYLTAEAPTFASDPFPGLGWRVVVRQPMSVVLATTHRLRALFIGGALLVGAAAAAIAWLVAGRLIRPVTELARDAGRLKTGEHLAPSFAPAVDELPEVAAVRDAFQRVTGEALERAERLLSQLDSIYRHAPVGLCAVDAQSRTLRVNQVWSDAFGPGHRADVAAPAAAQEHSAAFTAALGRVLRPGPGAMENLEVEAAAAGAGGPRVWQVGLAPFFDGAGAVLGAIAVATDVTGIRHAEQALRRADARKNDFVAMLAHELRNPLAPIVNAIEILNKEPQPALAQRMRDMVKQQVRHMVHLIDDLLDISRLNHGKIQLDLREVSVAEACAACAEAAQPLFQARAQRLELDIEEGLPAIRADRVRIAQVIGNLLDNAGKFSARGGVVRLRAGARAGAVEIAVQDEGRGMAPELIPHVFELFMQGDSSLERSEGGLGIGLSIVRSIVEMHGGSVVARSDGPGRGSSFTVTLPVPQAPGHAQARDREASSVDAG